MNKMDREYLERRVDGIVKCTNGTIATIFNKQKKGTGLTDNKKYKLIASGEAKVKELNEIVNKEKYYGDSQFKILLDCFDYPTTASQLEKIAFNKTIDNQAEELMQEVTLEGKRLIDKVVLGILPMNDVPDALHALGEMASLARRTI